MRATLGSRLIPLLATAALAGRVGAQAPSPSLAELEARALTDSLDAELRFRLAGRYWDGKRYDDAERQLEASIAIDPRYAPAHLALAFLPYERRPKLWDEERKNKVPAAWLPVLEESYRRRRHAFLLDPLVDLRVVGTRAPPENMWIIPDYGAVTTEFIQYLGIAAFAVTRYELAYSAFEEYIRRRYPGAARDSLPEFLLWYRGLAAAHLNLHARSIADFQVLLARETSRERADTLVQIPLETNHYRYVLAVLYERWRKPVDAVALYQEALAHDLGLYMAHVRLAQLYRSRGMWSEAVEAGRRAVAANPDDPTALRELGVILGEAGHPQEAIEALGQAMAANPRDPLAAYELALERLRQNQPEGARSALSRFLAMAPTRYSMQITDARRRLADLQ